MIQQSYILNVKPKDALIEFLELCQSMENINVERVYKTAMATIAYLRGNKEQRQYLQLGQELEEQWYKSLANDQPDWSVYGTDYYLGELWACWIIYSRTYLRNILIPRSLPPDGIVADLGQIQTIIDLGCGFGYTTAALREIFPNAEIIATNLDGIIQTDLAKKMGRRYNFHVVSGIEKIELQADLIFASEYFEHIYRPLDHLREIINILNPQAFLIASAFNARAIGHFQHYDIDGKRLGGKSTSRLFNAELRRLDYKKIKTRLWNNRPSYWKRI